MPRKQIQAAVSVNREPKEVIGFVSDIRNRLKYLQSLKSVSNVEGSPAQATQRWNWTWELMGHEFEGTGRDVAFEAARLYSFSTEGDIVSRFNYRAERENGGTRLSIDVDFEVPEVFVDHNDLDGLLTVTGVRAQDVALKLKQVMETADK